MRNYTRLDKFLTLIRKQDSALNYGDGLFTRHSHEIIDKGLEILGDVKGKRILDVGCGMGYALDRFRGKGAIVTGITIDEMELEFCREKGHDVRFMDMSFLEFDDSEFDVVWARHCLEHSIMPYFNLYEFNRVLKTEGKMYVEIPAPNANGHENNKNHFSVMSDIMWLNLFNRLGFKELTMEHIDFKKKSGKLMDRYYRLIGTKSN